MAVPARKHDGELVSAESFEATLSEPSTDTYYAHWLLPADRPDSTEILVQRVSRFSGPALLAITVTGLTWLLF